jgi:hypothetical protein
LCYHGRKVITRPDANLVEWSKNHLNGKFARTIKRTRQKPIIRDDRNLWRL